MGEVGKYNIALGEGVAEGDLFRIGQALQQGNILVVLDAVDQQGIRPFRPNSKTETARGSRSAPQLNAIHEGVEPLDHHGRLIRVVEVFGGVSQHEQVFGGRSAQGDAVAGIVELPIDGLAVFKAGKPIGPNRLTGQARGGIEDHIGAGVIQRHGPQGIHTGGKSIGAEAVVETGPAAVVDVDGEDRVLEGKAAGFQREGSRALGGQRHNLGEAGITEQLDVVAVDRLHVVTRASCHPRWQHARWQARCVELHLQGEVAACG